MKNVDIKVINLLTEMHLKLDKIQDEYLALEIGEVPYIYLCRINSLILEVLEQHYFA